MPSINNSKCVLVLGATAGIGRALATRIKALPGHPKVIAVGRRQERLDELAKAGFETARFDISQDVEIIRKFVEGIVTRYPDLDTVIFSAGFEYEFDLTQGVDFSKLQQELHINYTAIVTVILSLIPHFSKLSTQGQPCLFIPITSGLSITPAAWISNYSASKAALHNFLMSLRVSLDGQSIDIMEIIPPLVESELHDYYGSTEHLAKFWVPLEQYADSTLESLKNGELHIPYQQSKIAFDRHEEGKLDWVRQAMHHRKSWGGWPPVL
ncbi:hypothetical protein AX16_007602 [Volvariella volvacea WC 439]|nr:hypothetical protein AX16_007602 [Volvariella volvacea WC 439]